MCVPLEVVEETKSAWSRILGKETKRWLVQLTLDKIRQVNPCYSNLFSNHVVHNNFNLSHLVPSSLFFMGIFTSSMFFFLHLQNTAIFTLLVTFLCSIPAKPVTELVFAAAAPSIQPNQLMHPCRKESGEPHFSPGLS